LLSFLLPSTFPQAHISSAKLSSFFCGSAFMLQLLLDVKARLLWGCPPVSFLVCLFPFFGDCRRCLSLFGQPIIVHLVCFFSPFITAFDFHFVRLCFFLRHLFHFLFYDQICIFHCDRFPSLVLIVCFVLWLPDVVANPFSFFFFFFFFF
jgi:hypothetical protein